LAANASVGLIIADGWSKRCTAAQSPALVVCARVVTVAQPSRSKTIVSFVRRWTERTAERALIMSDILTLLKERQSTGLLTCDIAVGQQKSLIASIKTIFRHIFRLARRRLLQCQKIGMECGGPPSRHTISKRTDPACLSKDHAEPIYGHGLILIVRKQWPAKHHFRWRMNSA
jgi:hypothetical protein